MSKLRLRKVKQVADSHTASITAVQTLSLSPKPSAMCCTASRGDRRFTLKPKKNGTQLLYLGQTKCPRPWLIIHKLVNIFLRLQTLTGPLFSLNLNLFGEKSLYSLLAVCSFCYRIFWNYLSDQTPWNYLIISAHGNGDVTSFNLTEHIEWCGELPAPVPEFQQLITCGQSHRFCTNYIPALDCFKANQTHVQPINIYP